MLRRILANMIINLTSFGFLLQH